MTQSLKLGFKVGDYVEWISDADGPVQRGAIGCVVKASDNTMASRLTAETGLDLAAAWVLVEFDGMQVVVRKASENPDIPRLQA